MDIILPDDIFNQMITCMGYPFIKEEDLEINFDDIKKNIISQAFHTYFIWYPLTSDPDNRDVTGAFTINFPQDNVFSVVDVRINTARLGYGPYGNALVDERFIRNSGTYGFGGKYGTSNDYGFTAANITNRFEKQSVLEVNKAFRWHVNEQRRVVTGFTNTLSTLSISWASWSNDWNNIGYSQQRDVIKLSQAYILRFFGELRTMDNIPDAPIELNGQILIDRADKLEEDVLTKWKNRASPIIMRN